MNADPLNSYRPSYWFACFTYRDYLDADGAIGEDAVNETFFDYKLTRFTNGDLYVSCEVRAPIEGAAANGTGYFPAPVAESDSGPCAARLAYPPADSVDRGGWFFEVSDEGPRVDYFGDNLPNEFIVFGEADCDVFRTDANGAWEEATLADVLD